MIQGLVRNHFQLKSTSNKLHLACFGKNCPCIPQINEIFFRYIAKPFTISRQRLCSNRGHNVRKGLPSYTLSPSIFTSHIPLTVSIMSSTQISVMEHKEIVTSKFPLYCCMLQLIIFGKYLEQKDSLFTCF